MTMSNNRIRRGVHQWSAVLILVFLFLVSASLVVTSISSSSSKDDSNDNDNATTTSASSPLKHQQHLRESSTTTKATSANSHKGRRKLVARNSPVDERYLKTNAQNNTIRITLEGTERPLFSCPECSGEKLQAQQNDILNRIRAMFDRVQLLSSHQKLVNAMFVRLTLAPDQNPIDAINQIQEQQIPGLQKVYPHEEYQLQGLPMDEVDYPLGGTQASISDFCVTGHGIRIAVLDSGIDYTHARLGGAGTKAAYRRAFGRDKTSQRNKVVNNQFPTERVVGGYDFIGDEFATWSIREEGAMPDYDPIDAIPGHGTAVADAILQVAPEAQLLALKVCTTQTNACPDFAIARALEYALDPNGDGNTDDKVDIVNLSLGLPHFSPYHDFISKMLEEVFQLGVLPVVAIGNHGNIPFVAGFASISPNIFSVGSTIPANQYNFDENRGPMVAPYSSRGPGFNYIVKPDLLAPSGLFLAAAGSGDRLYANIEGTSFSAPLVSGAAALLKQKCDGLCSPFALRSILMNNANRKVRYLEDTPATEGAPVSLMGAGELQVYKSLNASFWAYSLEDIQPSISLGILNVGSNTVIRRTIRITNLSQQSHSLSLAVEFRNQTKAEMGALNIEVVRGHTVLPGNAESNCSSPTYTDLEVFFRIDATKVPPNHLTSTASNRNDPHSTLDVNELGFHIVVSSQTSGTDISIPGLAILRQASNVTVDSALLHGFRGGPTTVPVGLNNHGAGVAQIDAFQLLSFSPDDPENDFGNPVRTIDISMFGFRTITPSDERGNCTYLFEWVFKLWERYDQATTTIFEVQIDVNGDGDVDYFVFSSALQTRIGSSPGEIFVADSLGEVYCTGMHTDHSVDSSTFILRVCSESLGIKDPGSMLIQARTVSITTEGWAQTTDVAYASTVTYPDAEISAPSYDIAPGESLSSIIVNGSNSESNGTPPLGLILLTDSYRHAQSTGSSVKGSEALLLLQDFVEEMFEIPSEITEDLQVIPPAEDLQGPHCSWTQRPCPSVNDWGEPVVNAALEVFLNSGSETSVDSGYYELLQNSEEEEVTVCLPREIPRVSVPTIAPSFHPQLPEVGNEDSFAENISYTVGPSNEQSTSFVEFVETEKSEQPTFDPFANSGADTQSLTFEDLISSLPSMSPSTGSLSFNGTNALTFKPSTGSISFDDTNTPTFKPSTDRVEMPTTQPDETSPPYYFIEPLTSGSRLLFPHRPMGLPLLIGYYFCLVL